MGWWLWIWIGRSTEVRKELAALRHEKYVQDILRPFMSELAAKGNGSLPADLVVPNSRPLSRDKVTDLDRLVRETVSHGSATVLSVVPRSMELGEKYDQIPVDIATEGDLLSLRSFLMGICRLPFVKDFREIQFQSRGQDKVRMTILVIIAVS